MAFSAMKFSRTRLLALLLVAVFSIGAVGATTIASATDASAAKKKKKCKKGYKKVNGKCKKKKKAATSTKVSSVTLRLTSSSSYGFDFAGEVITKTPLTSIPVKVTASKGSTEFSNVVTATGDGTTTTLTFTGKVDNPLQKARPADRKQPTKVIAVADGVSSPAAK